MGRKHYLENKKKGKTNAPNRHTSPRAPSKGAAKNYITAVKALFCFSPHHQQHLIIIRAREANRSQKRPSLRPNNSDQHVAPRHKISPHHKHQSARSKSSPKTSIVTAQLRPTCCAAPQEERGASRREATRLLAKPVPPQSLSTSKTKTVKTLAEGKTGRGRRVLVRGQVSK